MQLSRVDILQAMFQENTLYHCISNWLSHQPPGMSKTWIVNSLETKDELAPRCLRKVYYLVKCQCYVLLLYNLTIKILILEFIVIKMHIRDLLDIFFYWIYQIQNRSQILTKHMASVFISYKFTVLGYTNLNSTFCPLNVLHNSDVKPKAQ